MSSRQVEESISSILLCLTSFSLSKEDGNEDSNLLQEVVLRSKLTSIEKSLESQVVYSRMLQKYNKEGDVFYSRSDLRVMIDSYKRKAINGLVSIFVDIYGDPKEQDLSSQDGGFMEYILHIAALFKVKPHHLRVLCEDSECWHSLKTRLYRKNSLRSSCFNGILPLHCCISAIGDHQAQRVSTFLEFFPESARARDKMNLLPLHYALLFEVNDCDIYQKLIMANPESLNMLLQVNEPMYNINSKSDEEMENTTTEQKIYSRLEIMSNCSRFLPFHIACCLSCPVEIIFLLLRNNPTNILRFHTSS